MLKIIENIGKRGALCECLHCAQPFQVKCRYTSKKSYLGCICTACKHGIVSIKNVNQSALKKWFTYDPVTGDWTFKHTTVSGVAGDIATSKHSGGYKTLRIGSVDYLAHRMAFVYMEDKLPEQVDHIDHDRCNNAWSNLREVSPRNNSLNCSKKRSNTTGINGVSYHLGLNKYRAYINEHGRQIHLGVFDTLEEAKEARHKADIDYGYHPNHGS